VLSSISSSSRVDENADSQVRRRQRRFWCSGKSEGARRSPAVSANIAFDAASSDFGDVGFTGWLDWDLDGDGTFEARTYNPAASVSRIYPSRGTRTVRVKGSGASVRGWYDGPPPEATYELRVVDRIAPVLRASVSSGASPRFTLRLSEPARVVWRLQRRVKRRWKAVGSFARTFRRGRSSVRLPARVSRHRINAGRYRATLIAKDRSGNRSRARRLSFTANGG
jgi:hypothetical protein